MFELTMESAAAKPLREQLENRQLCDESLLH